MDWFLYDNGFRHERVKGFLLILGFYLSLKRDRYKYFWFAKVIPVFIFAFQVSNFIHASINIFFISNQV